MTVDLISFLCICRNIHACQYPPCNQCTCNVSLINWQYYLNSLSVIATHSTLHVHLLCMTLYLRFNQYKTLKTYDEFYSCNEQNSTSCISQSVHAVWFTQCSALPQLSVLWHGFLAVCHFHKRMTSVQHQLVHSHLTSHFLCCHGLIHSLCHPVRHMCSNLLDDVICLETETLNLFVPIWQSFAGWKTDHVVVFNVTSQQLLCFYFRFFK